MKLSSVNTIHVKEQQCSLFHFQVLKYMLGNVYINKIHARQCLYIISLYCREGSISLLYPKESFKCNFKTARKDFSTEQLPIDSFCYYVNKRIIFQLINKSLVFNLIAI